MSDECRLTDKELDQIEAQVEKELANVHSVLDPGFTCGNRSALRLTAALRAERRTTARLAEACEGALDFLVHTYKRSGQGHWESKGHRGDRWVEGVSIDVTKITKDRLMNEICNTGCEHECLALFDALQAKGEPR